jgi:K+-sensing histidine kinase KdpD
MDRAERIAPYIVAPLVLALIVLLGRATGANEITVGFLLLTAVLGLATWGGWTVGAMASVAATLCLNYFFLPPTGTLSIQEPSNWVALGCFLASSTLVSRLVTQARKEAEEARALAIERERLLREATHLEAVRESEALKTGLLRAVSHDLRTPLTSMRLGIDTLKRFLTDQPEALAIQRSLSLEQERLSRRIGNLLALARLEAGVAQPHPEPTPASSLIRAARESLALALSNRTVEVLIEPDCPDLWTDPSLTLEILVNLLENAARVAEGTLTFSAGPAPDAPDQVRIEVMDRGPGLSPGLRTLLAGSAGSAGSDTPGVAPRKAGAAAGDSTSGGLGLRIAMSLAEANGGSLILLDRPGGGTIARLTLPAARYEEEP